jgi:hypothetical protein
MRLTYQPIEVGGNVVHLQRMLERFQRDLRRLDALGWDLNRQIRSGETKK